MKYLKTLLFVLLFGIVSCSSDQESNSSEKVMENLDYHLRIYQTDSDERLKSFSSSEANLKDQILFYQGEEAFPFWSKEKMNQYNHEHIQKVDVFSICYLDGKSFTKTLSSHLSKFYFYELVAEEVLLSSTNEANCDFTFKVFADENHSISENQSIRLNLLKSSTISFGLEKSELRLVDFKRIHEYINRDLFLEKGEIEFLCLLEDGTLSLNAEKLKKVRGLGSLTLDTEPNAKSCRLRYKRGDRWLLGERWLSNEEKLFRAYVKELYRGLLSYDRGSLTTYHQIEVENISPYSLELILPKKLGQMRLHQKNHENTINYTYMFAYELTSLKDPKATYSQGEYRVFLKPGEKFFFEAGKIWNCGPFIMLDSKNYAGVDFSVSPKIFKARIHGGVDKAFTQMNIPFSGLDFYAMRTENESRFIPSHRGRRIELKVGENCHIE